MGFNFSRPSTSFYDTIFNMAASKLNMLHNDPSKLHTIINLVSKPMFLNMSNIMVYIKMIIGVAAILKINMAARKYEIFHHFQWTSGVMDIYLSRICFWLHTITYSDFRFISNDFHLYIIIYYINFTWLKVILHISCIQLMYTRFNNTLHTILQNFLHVISF